MLAAKEPQRLSPNVLLRPVIEAALLPRWRTWPGPGELAYLPECEPVYTVWAWRRSSRWAVVGALIEARVRKVRIATGSRQPIWSSPKAVSKPNGAGGVALGRC